MATSLALGYQIGGSPYTEYRTVLGLILELSNRVL
jgi:hypothetical protein